MSDGTRQQDSAARCFHSTPGLEQRLDLLLHLVEFGQQAVVLTGPEGAGKTALLAELLERAPSNWAVAVLDGEVAATVEAVAERLAEAWDIGIAAEADDTVDDPVEALCAALVAWARRDRVPLVLIDDADRANDALLVSTFNVISRVEGRARPRLLLAGDPSLEERLRSAPLRDLMTGLPHSLEMPPLEEGEVAAYLAARQEADGLAGVRLPADAVRRLQRETGGLPGPLYDRFVRAVAAVAAAEDEPARRLAAAPALGAPQARKYAIVMGLVALVFVGSLVVRGLSWREPGSAGEEAGSVIETLTLPPLEHAAPPPPTVVFPGKPGDGEGAAEGRVQGTGPASTAADATSERVEAGSAGQHGAGDASPTAVAEAGPGQRAEATVPEPAAAVAPPEGATAPDSGPSSGDPAEGPGQEEMVASAQDTEAGPEASGAPLRPESEVPAVPADVAATPSPEAAPAAPPEPAVAPASPSPAPPARGGTEADLAWLEALDSTDWVLQVFASDNPKAARDALARHGIADRARVIPTTRNGAGWYVVVMGPWPDRTTASRALADLPSGLRSQGPFPKRVSELKAASRSPR